jgi:hypothetical protein
MKVVRLRKRMRRLGPAVLLALAVSSAGPAAAYETKEVYAALGLKTRDVLSGTILEAKVLPGDAEQVVCVATYLTGKKEKAEAVNVRMGVFNNLGSGLVSVYERDFGSEEGGYVANGDLQLLDLDLDRINEIVVSFDSYKDPLIDQRLGEVIVHGDTGFEPAWRGPLEYDATKAARDVPLERRDRFTREIDYSNTLRTRGLTLFMNKKMIAVAGERLSQPRVVQETFPLRASAEPR